MLGSRSTRRTAHHCVRGAHHLPALARFGELVATDLGDVTSDPAALDSTGFWAVVADCEGHLVCARFGAVHEPVPASRPGAWRGPAAGDCAFSLDSAAYTAGVRRIREHIAAGGLPGEFLPRAVRAAA